LRSLVDEQVKRVEVLAVEVNCVGGVEVVVVLIFWWSVVMRAFVFLFFLSGCSAFSEACRYFRRG